MLSVIFIAEYILSGQHTNSTLESKRFEFWIRLELLAFTSNIIAHIIGGLIRLFEHGNGLFMNKGISDAENYEDFLKGSLKGDFSSWFSVEVISVSVLVYTSRVCREEGDQQPIEAVFSWWLPITAILLLACPISIITRNQQLEQQGRFYGVLSVGLFFLQWLLRIALFVSMFFYIPRLHQSQYSSAIVMVALLAVCMLFTVTRKILFSVPPEEKKGRRRTAWEGDFRLLKQVKISEEIYSALMVSCFRMELV